MTRPSFKPFTEGPVREKKLLSLGFYRTGSQSLKEALTILGYRDVFHSSAMADDADKWLGLGCAADDNIACLPSYTGRIWDREDFDRYFGPCEALTDVTPLGERLLEVYPNCQVILVHRDFDSWVSSFQRTLVLPSSDGPLAWMSGHWFEPIIGIYISQMAWKMYCGLLGVCDMRKTRDRKIMRAAYDRHYSRIRNAVPKERLLEIDLKDLDWGPLCSFLGKDVPKDVPFPRLNESKVFSNQLRQLHKIALLGATMKVSGYVAVVAGLVGLGLWATGTMSYVRFW